MKSILLFIILISSCTLAQNFSRFVIVQKDGFRVEGTKGIIADTLFNGFDEKGNDYSTPLNNISKIYSAGSSKTLTMGALGFLSGLAIGLSFDYNYSTSSFRGNPALIGSFSALGLIIGGLVGSNSYYWKTVDVNSLKPKLPFQEISSVNLQFNFNF